MCLKWSFLQRMLQNQLYSLTIVYPPSIQPIFTEHLPCIRHCTGHGGCNKRLRPSLGKFTVYQGKQLFIEREHNTPVGENPQDSSVRHRSSQNLSEKRQAVNIQITKEEKEAQRQSRSSILCPVLFPRYLVSGSLGGPTRCLPCTTHIAIFASLDLPNHFGRKR